MTRHLSGFALALALLYIPSSSHASFTNEQRCLADVVYGEARGESRIGQIAVAEVVINRVGKHGFPSSVCGVAKQKGQFVPKRGSNDSYDVAMKVANEVLSGDAPEVTAGATYFHTPAVRPSWAKRFTRTKQIGSHIFYKR